jgi:outer membrane immunogenic protein
MKRHAKLHPRESVMKKLVVAAVVLGALIMPAMAADVPAPAYTKAPPPPAFNWTGFYLGGNAGWGSIDDNALPFCFTPSGVWQGPGCDTVPGGRVRGSGLVGGGQAGYNWQFARLVVGLETDIQGGDIKASTNVPGPFEIIGLGSSGPGVSFTAQEKLSWIGTLRGRFGVAFDTVMIYATGGFAYGGVSVSQAHILPAVQYPSSASRDLNGWTFGGGVEWAFLGNLSARVEGLYYDLGTISTSSGSVPPISPTYVAGKNFDAQGAIIRAGLNWRFGEPFYAGL